MPNPPPFLILGSSTDPHVSRVAKEMGRRGVKVFVLDYRNGTRFSFHLSSKGELRLCVDEEWVPEATLVWERSIIVPGTELFVRGDDERSTRFAAQEWRALYALLNWMSKKRAVNALISTRCMYKPYQQAIAVECGFQAPETLVTNDKSSALSFLEESSEGIIMKSLSESRLLPATRRTDLPINVFTMRINRDDLRSASEEEILYCPHFFQTEIMKKFELRVIVIGQIIYAFRIDSQSKRVTEVDWRRGAPLVSFTPYNVDEGTAAKIRLFMSKMQLFTGSIDLIIDRNDEIWFLECNETGAWAWLDDIVDGAISHAFCDAFTNRLNELANLS